MAEQNQLNAALGEFLAGKTADETAGPGVLLLQLTKRLVERALDAEPTQHLGYDRGAAPGRARANSRNGTSRKTVQGDFG